MMLHQLEEFELILAAEAIKKQRNNLLDEADIKSCNAERWEQMSEETKQIWRDYKQALRDLPKQEGFPIEVIFPDMPL